MARIESGSLVFDEAFIAVADARSATRAFLLARGNTEWDVDNAPLPTFETAWWSDTYSGFTHDCSLHPAEEGSPETCFDDRRVVTVVAGIPDPLLGIHD